MRRLATAALAALALVVPGCGDDEDDRPVRHPAAGEFTPPSDTPGVPEGALYDVDGNGWAKLGKGGQLAAAAGFIADQEDRCEGAAPRNLVPYVTISYGTDFPLTVPATDVLLEACDAEAQGPNE